MSEYPGPFLAAALICERVLQEQDGTISAIRLIDRLTHFVAGPEVPDDLPPFQQQIALLMAFKSGEARGRHTITLIVEKPSGERGDPTRFPVHFEQGEDRGVNLVVTTMFQPDQEGLYWFDVYLGDDRITRMPLRVMYQPAPTGLGG